jgi:hypothetical protein
LNLDLDEKERGGFFEVGISVLDSCVDELLLGTFELANWANIRCARSAL